MTSLEITRSLAASPERVWHALTDPAALAAWFWPHLDNTVETDPRVGGRYRIAGPRAGIAVCGEYLEVDPPRRLVFTWRWEGEEEQSRVTVELRRAGEGTTLTLVHDRVADEATRDRFADGWRDCLDRLSTSPSDPWPPRRRRGVHGDRAVPDSLGVCGWASTSTAWWPTSTAAG